MQDDTDNSMNEQREPQMRLDPSSSSPVAAAALALVAEGAGAARLAQSVPSIEAVSERNAAARMRNYIAALAAQADARAAVRRESLWHSCSPAQRLHQDGVASCLGFLSLKDFAAAARSCRFWREGAMRVQSLGAVVVGGRVCTVAASPFRKLVTSAILHSETSSLALRELRTLVRLRSLELCLLPAMLDGATVVFPSQLESAQFNFRGCARPEFHGKLNASFLMRGLESCASLTRLELHSLSVHVDPAALASLQQLRELTIDSRTPPTAALLCAIKTLPLRSLFLLWGFNAHWEQDWLELLLTLPHALQDSLQAFRCNDLTLRFARLVSLRSLTELNPALVSAAELPLLASFLQLRSLRLVFEPQLQAAVVLPHLTHCSLTELSLFKASFAAGDIAALCAVQPRLQRLSLVHVTVTDLRGLESLSQLRDLRLYLTDGAMQSRSPMLLNQLSQCASLQSIDLCNVHERALSAADRAALTPPSAVLPRLTKFRSFTPNIYDRVTPYQNFRHEQQWTVPD